MGPIERTLNPVIVNEYGYICIVIGRPLSAETNGNVMYYLTLLPTRNANIKLAITTLRKRLDYIYRDFIC